MITPSSRNAPEALMNLPPIEGVGNAGCPLHPQPRVHLGLVERTRVTTSTPESPGIPARKDETATTDREHLSVICGRPLLASSFLTLRTIWSASVICPACWCGTMAAGPDEFRLPRSLSLRRARGS